MADTEVKLAVFVVSLLVLDWTVISRSQTEQNTVTMEGENKNKNKTKLI